MWVVNGQVTRGCRELERLEEEPGGGNWNWLAKETWDGGGAERESEEGEILSLGWKVGLGR